MLILTRRVGEAICVGSNIRVTVLDIKGGQMRIGIEAPPTLPVDREEVYERKLREKRTDENGPGPDNKSNQT